MPRQKPKKNVKVEKAVEKPEEKTEEVVSKKRHVPTKESVDQEFQDLVTVIEEEIARRREQPSSKGGVKFLRTVNKRLKTIRSHTARVTKKGKTTNRKGNSNSGFLKPVGITKELADFTGWDPAEKRSRVDVTRFLCAYIKDNDLQNPSDKRQIQVDKNPKLQKLLSFPKNNEEPLTYYSLQRYLKHHFVKDDEPEPTPEPEKPAKSKKGKKGKKARK